MLARQRGISLIQIMAVLAIASTIILAAMPPLRELYRGMRLDAASRRVLSDVRGARSRAVTTGWHCRFVGLKSTGSYRVLARRSTAVAWPATGDAAFSSPTQLASPWTDLAAMFPGVHLRPFDPGAPDEYWLSFDARGVPIENSTGLMPMAIMNEEGSSRLVAVSQTGRLSLE